MVSTLGSAEFSEHKGVKLERAYHGDLVVLGRYAYEDKAGESFQTRMPTRHFVSVSGSRGGKGACLIIPNLVTYRGSAIVIDPKGENAYITAERRRQMGQKTHILDPWNEVNRRYGGKSGIMEEVATFNPLSVLDPDSEHFADDVAYIADALIINQSNESYWDDSARELVAGLIAFAVYDKGEAASLSLVRHLLTEGDTGISKLALTAQNWDVENLARRKLNRFKGYISPKGQLIVPKELQSIISTALTQTAFLDSPILGKNMDETSFSFEELIEGTATIYLVLPVDKLQTYGRWLRLMVSLGIRTVSRKTKNLNLPILFILDEFGTIGKLSAVSQAMGLMAGLQVCIWAFLQDLNQLKHDYGDQWETFIANAECLTGFDIMDQFTAEYFSKMMGQMTIEHVPEVLGQNRQHPSPITVQIHSRPLLYPEEIRNTNQFLGFCIQRGGQPFVFGKTPYFENPHIYEHCRPDPHFNPPEWAQQKTEEATPEQPQPAPPKVKLLPSYEEKDSGFWGALILWGKENSEIVQGIIAVILMVVVTFIFTKYLI